MSGLGTLRNAPVTIDDTADLDDAAAKIKRSKVSDYATSCSSENSVFIQADIYGKAVAACARQSGVLLTDTQRAQLQRVMWVGGRLNEQILNITRLARLIPPVVPTEEQLWGHYLRKYGA